jgi:hypothetical protein
VKRFKINKRVKCADGFHMSVQANAGSYCCPRSDAAERYIEVEIGYPSEREDLLMQFAEDPDTPTQTVYAYVPSELAYLVIAKHGGMVSGELPKGVPCPEGWNNEAT